MGKLYLFAIIAGGWYFYTHPEQFDALRGEASAQAVQAVDVVQSEATASVMEAIGSPDGGVGQ